VASFIRIGTRLWPDDEARTQRGNHYWAKAEERAQELLRSWLSPKQREQYDAEACFEVVGSDTGKRYRICKGRAFNIQELDARDLQVRAWCFSAESVAIGDVNLA
jgi:hypothetical protein